MYICEHIHAYMYCIDTSHIQGCKNQWELWKEGSRSGLELGKGVGQRLCGTWKGGATSLCFIHAPYLWSPASAWNVLGKWVGSVAGSSSLDWSSEFLQEKEA